MTRVPSRRRTGEAVRRVEKFVDLMTEDHKVPNAGGESRNNHRYAVVVQDLPLNGFNLVRVKQKCLRMFLGPSVKPKIFCSDNSLQFGKSCEVLSWNHRTSTPRRSETHGIADRAVRKVQGGTSAV